MSRTIRISLFLFVVAALFSGGISGVDTAYAQNSVRFSGQDVENRFPDELILRARVSSSAGEIVSAKFVYTNDSRYSSKSYSKKAVAVEPGTEVPLEYVLDTRDLTTPPMMPFTYYWDVVDADGEHYQSEPATVRYDDVRFDWQVLDNSDVGVWWHDRPASFGEAIFEIANTAIERQRELFQADLDYQMRIVIYNSSDEFAAWHSLAHDWVGGETFSNYGITTQIVEDSGYQSSWLNGVIPHEISHLYFAQVTHNPTTSVPVWLNEGLAQYNEFVDHQWELDQVRTAAKNGKIIPLSSLANGFGAFNEERIYLAYYESVSAVTYFVETYGGDSLGALLRAYKQGQPTDEAFRSAIGIGVGEFEAGWASWTGMSGDYATNTPWPLPTFRPSPTMRVLSAADPAPPTGTPAPLPTERPSPTGTAPAPTPPLPCMSFLAALGLSVGSVLYMNRRKNE